MTPAQRVMAVAQEKEWAPCSVPTDFLSGCRRAASFPFFGDHSLAPISVLKVRSQSESEGLNSLRFAKINLDTLRRKNRDSFRECEETSDCNSDISSSEDGDSPCASPSIMDLVVEVTTSSKKTVRFADDCGKELYSVKVMTEPSDQPPYLSPKILRRWRGDNDEEDEKPKEPQAEWKMLFKQPACDYVRFRETLEHKKVAVENVLVKPESHKIIGTVKVANIAFEKKVFVRLTQNHWKSYVDQQCVYQPSTSKIHDTFTFELEIPRVNEKIQDIEFCVCYVANGDEHWDSNHGENFKLHCEEPKPEARTTYPSLFGSYKALDRDDAYRMHQDDWSGFASWRSLSTDHPYW